MSHWQEGNHIPFHILLPFLCCTFLSNNYQSQEWSFLWGHPMFILQTAPHPSITCPWLICPVNTTWHQFLFTKFCTDAKIMAWEIQVTAYTFDKVTWSAIQYTLPVRQFPNCLINEVHSLYWNTKIIATKREGQDKGTFFLFLTYTLYSGADEDVSVLEKRNFTSLHGIISHRRKSSTYKLLYSLTTSYQSDPNIFLNPWFPNTLNSDKLQLSNKRMRRYSSHSVPYKVCQTSGCHDKRHFG